MIIRVLDVGKDAAGLTRYLFGPGRANEHTNQRLVAGSSELHAEWGGGPLTMAEATHLGRMVEMSWRRQYAPELALVGQGDGGISRANLASGEGAVAGQEHVLHIAISMPAEAEKLTDKQWQTVAEEYLRGMGYLDAPTGQEDPSWFAVNHGLSAKGNDHIHLVVCTVRRDGSTIDLRNSGRRSQQVRRDRLEKLPFVTPLHDQGRDPQAPTLKGYTAAEHAIAQDPDRARGIPGVPDRVQLQRIVRAAAAQASNEAQFINTVLSHPGVGMEPSRWTAGQVTGYRVQLNDGPWLNASQLASDLTLRQLRNHWTETPSTTETAQALWAGEANRLDKLTATTDVPHQLEEATRHLQAFNTHLAALEAHDTEAWAQALTGTAGITTVIATGRGISRHPDGAPSGFGPDAGAAADSLARQALADTHNRSTSTGPRVPAGLSSMELATRHVQLALRAGSSDKHRGWLAVLQQLGRTVHAIRTAREARGELQAALALQRQVEPALDRLVSHLSRTSGDVRQPPERTSEQLLRLGTAARPHQHGPAATDSRRRGRR